MSPAELGVAPLSWVSVEAVEAGTRQVVTDGSRILHDRFGLLALLVAACAR